MKRKLDTRDLLEEEKLEGEQLILYGFPSSDKMVVPYEMEC